MPNISFILKCLSSKVIRSKVTYFELPNIEGIMLLRNQSSLPEGYLFIANGEEVCGILSRADQSAPVTILTSGDYGDPAVLETGKNINLIATSLDIFDLYNKVNVIVKSYKDWSYNILKTIIDESDLKHIISKIGDMLHAPVFLLDSNFAVMCGHMDNQIKDIFADEMLAMGCLSPESAEKLFEIGSSKLNSENDCLKFSSESTENTYNIEKLTYKDNSFAYLIFITNSAYELTDAADLCAEAAVYIKKLLSYENTWNTYKDTAFSSLLSDLIESRVSEPEEIENRLKLIQYPLNLFKSCIVIQFRGGNTQQPPYNCVISQLEKIMPGNNITVYQGDIVILFSYTVRTWHLNIDYEKLHELLVRYDAFAGISNGTRNHTMIRTIYLLAKSTVKLGIAVCKDKSKRIFTHEEYSMFCIIDLCAKHLRENYKLDDIVYLSHPAAVALTRYDRKHNSNLRDTLFCYLINDRNLNKTSKIMYMHRNTTSNKINKITEIIGESLDNGQLQLRLLFSCLLIRYYEEYMNGNISDDSV